MPAPTALQRRPEEATDGAEKVPLPMEVDDELLIDPTNSTPADTKSSQAAPVTSENDVDMHIDEEGRPLFAPAKNTVCVPASDPFFARPNPNPWQDGPLKVETRKVPIPPHRMSPLKASWSKIYPPIVEHLKLQVRMNVKNRAVELRSSKHTTDPGAIQKGEDFVKAFSLGFDVDDAIALLRLDDLYIETFEIKDVKTLTGEHLGRAIGRIAGKDGKMKFAIENVSRTRVVLADQKIHILGGFRNIHIAREAIVSLILGSPPVSLISGSCI
ncbi:pre-rRNA-processing protein pno1 [Trichoglossum hirsutum]|uniref:Pre-rRNA-processing protein PNO1 n=1 Tax=Trichoglossum hirsutum TaxID=265104 RepID=A0A9P8RQG8_9PEZI|nr:pre-rRNA-processing protein pno1 [Trichoglossum hirsutum]